MNAKPLSDRIALVTGASRGIGREAAKALAAAGAQVVAVARTQGALEELDDEIRAAGGPRPTLVPMDIVEGANLDQLGYTLHQRHGRLDILVHSAAILGPITPVSHLEPAHWDKVFAANATASYRLIRATERLLKASDAGRAVFLSTSVAEHPRAFWGAYAASKAAMGAIVRSWADEIENTNVRAVLLSPGAMRTKMRAEAMPGEDPNTLPHPSEIGPLIVELVQGDRGLPTDMVLFRDWKAASKA